MVVSYLEETASLGGIVFLLEGIGFLIIGTLIMNKLKNSRKKYYEENVCKLKAATFFLSLPLILYGTLNLFVDTLIMSKLEYKNEGENEDYARLGVKIVFYLIGVLIPTIA